MTPFPATVVLAADHASDEVLVDAAAAVLRRGRRPVVVGERAGERLRRLHLGTCVDVADGAGWGQLEGERPDVAIRLDGDGDDWLEQLEAAFGRAHEVTTEHGLVLDAGWSIVERAFEPDQIMTTGSNFLAGNGYLGYRGTFPEWGHDAYVACTVSDTYDCADGKWRELTNVPNALWAQWSADVAGTSGATVQLGVVPDATVGPDDGYERRLDLRLGRVTRRLERSVGEDRLRLDEERFASLADHHLVVQRQRWRGAGGVLRLRSGIDAALWQLNGEHLPTVELAQDDDVLVATAVTAESGIEIAVAHALAVAGAEVRSQGVNGDDRWIARDLVLEPGGEVTAWQVMAVFSSNDVDDPRAAAVAAARQAVVDGHALLLARHLADWDRLWVHQDVEIDGDPVSQSALRFGLYHNAVATPRHTDHLPIGARGLSCQAYQGGAFWDQETFNLPVYLYTEPHVARQLLVYRHRTLDGARRKAARLGYRGAYYAWISGRTGDEICPDFFFKDVLTGRWMRNHFNDWQMHVSPDIAMTIRRYVQTTGDYGFLVSHGAEMLFEIARFLDSFVYLKHDLGRYEALRVLGPDEFHENVDNNTFTNYQIELALRTALETLEWLAETDAQALAALRERLGLADEEVERWRDIRARIWLRDPDPDSGLIEPFDGFFELEDVRPAELRERLLDADEYWGWPNGVAVHTQVSKQADVEQLFVLQPERFGPEVMAANHDYYLPRTSHKSSLSQSAYAIVAAWLGRAEEAYELFLASATVDLFARDAESPGGTFIGGIHTAAAGASWQVVALGFLGLKVVDEQVRLRPGLPPAWDRLRLSVIVRGCRLHLDVGRRGGAIVASDTNPGPITVHVHDAAADLEPGQRQEWT